MSSLYLQEKALSLSKFTVHIGICFWFDFDERFGFIKLAVEGLPNPHSNTNLASSLQVNAPSMKVPFDKLVGYTKVNAATCGRIQLQSL
jgi:hypothetical protein